MLNWLNKTHVGDCRDLLKRMAADGVRVQTCVTSPPYFGLRDYGVAGQIGLEPTPGEYVEQIVRVFRLVREILSDDGTLWLNLGDSYAGYHGNKNVAYDAAPSNKNGYFENQRTSTANRNGIKPKDLLGIPWRVAFGLQADGWYLRSDIIEEVELYCPCGCGYVLEERVWRWSQDRELIWKKPNPMCESVRDRPTKAHEYIFLLSKSQQYYFDANAIKEPAAYGLPNSPESISSPYGQGFTRRARTVGVGDNARPSKAVPNISGSRENPPSDIESWHLTGVEGHAAAQPHVNGMRNKRSVWTVATTPYIGAHFATFPRKLIDPCVLAGSRPGDVVIDPFAGSGTTRQVATSFGRHYIGCELNPAYLDLDEHRQTTTGMPL
jgi:DNA modification methylase